MKLSLILEAVDRGADRAVDRLRRSTRELGRDSSNAGRDVAGMGRGLDRAARSASAFDRAARRAGDGVVGGARRGARALLDLDRRIQFSQAQMERMAYRTGSFIGGTLRSGLMAGTALAGAGLSAALYKVVTAGLTFEKFRTQLEGLEGSEAAGRKAFSWVTDFAAKTPYELTEVMEAFIALKAYGIDPTNGTLRSLGDTAAGMGKGLMQAVEMIADAQTGEFERIKEFGIKAGVEGDKVTFRWQRNGKEMSKTVRQSSTEIRAALLGIMDGQFAGGMERLARTTAGKWSNLMDSLSQTANRVWEGGFGDAVNKQIDRVNDALGRMEKDGSLQRWADRTGKGIGDLIDAIAGGDWQAMGADISTVGGAIGDLADALRELDRWRDSIRQFQRDAESVAGSLGGISWDSQVGGLRYHPPSWMKGAAAAPGAPTVPPAPSAAPYRDVATRQRAAGVRWPARPSADVPFVDAAEPQTRPAPRRTSDADWRRALANPRPAVPARAPASKPQPAPPPPKGKITIDIRTPQGTSARPTKIAASGVDIEVNTGRAMGSFA